MWIWFLSFINYIDFRVNLIEFHCSIFVCANCISFEVLNASIWMLGIIALCHFLSTLISSNSKRFFHVFRYSINFWTFKFSVVVKTMCCSVRESCIVGTSKSTFYVFLVHRSLLSRYSIVLIIEIWFFDFAIRRLLNYTSDFAVFAKFFFSCILALLVIFRDTTCIHEFDDDAILDAFWSLYCLRIKEIRELEFEFFESWFSAVFLRG